MKLIKIVHLVAMLIFTSSSYASDLTKAQAKAHAARVLAVMNKVWPIATLDQVLHDPSAGQKNFFGPVGREIGAWPDQYKERAIEPYQLCVEALIELDAWGYSRLYGQPDIDKRRMEFLNKKSRCEESIKLA